MSRAAPSAEDLQVLDKILADTATSPTTRRRLLGLAAAGAVGAGAVAGGPVSAALAQRGRGESPRRILSGGGGVGLFESIETADTTELMGYLTGVTAFAKRGQARAARFLAEACGVEAEHRAIARFAQTALGGRQQISIDRSFEPWSIRTVAGMIAALERAGIGFGERGAEPGRFYEFPGDPVRSGAGLRNNGRRPA